MKSLIPNAFLMFVAVCSAYWPMDGMLPRSPMPIRTVALHAEPLALPAVAGPLRPAGAWMLHADDRRLFGLSSLAIDGGGFVAAGDDGSVVRFDRPGPSARVWLSDMRDGPGLFGRRRSRDAEALLRDGDGWLVTFEQRHSLWRYNRDFRHGVQVMKIGERGWSNNRGAEGLSRAGPTLLAWREDGNDVRRIEGAAIGSLPLRSSWSIADAANAPDGSTWLLLRRLGAGKIMQAIAPAVRSGRGYDLGPIMPLGKGRLDNFEGMAIERSPGGGLRFWLVSDNGSRVAPTLLAVWDLSEPAKTNARR